MGHRWSVTIERKIAADKNWCEYCDRRTVAGIVISVRNRNNYKTDENRGRNLSSFISRYRYRFPKHTILMVRHAIYTKIVTLSGPTIG
jgi:hypothetical protein